VIVVTVKSLLSRRVAAVGAEIGSTAVRSDAWHHLSDALTSAAAFVGILLDADRTRDPVAHCGDPSVEVPREDTADRKREPCVAIGVAAPVSHVQLPSRS
jgi:hypothetical protein